MTETRGGGKEALPELLEGPLPRAMCTKHSGHCVSVWVWFFMTVMCAHLDSDSQTVMASLSSERQCDGIAGERRGRGIFLQL